jgi:hypothetical protein
MRWNLTDRQAAEATREPIDWKHALRWNVPMAQYRKAQYARAGGTCRREPRERRAE